MNKNLELYVHIPFCARKCNYCDFLSACRTYDDQEAYFKKLLEEIAYSSVLAAGYTVVSVFIGGGTPSLVEPDRICDIMYVIRKYYVLSEDAEISIECNPGSTLRHKFAKYRDAGINRLSIGLQSADNRELQTLGRIHTFEEFLKSYQSARMEGFSNINVDLMNCIPGQTEKSWRRTLKNVLMLKPEHVSVYNLIVEEGTNFEEQIRTGRLQLPSEEEMTEIDRVTDELMAAQKYGRYEVSNYAKEGYECRHNRGYWTGVNYLGFGLGAAGLYNGCRYRNTADFHRYLSMDFRNLSPESYSGTKAETEVLTPEEQMREFMILGLRLTAGISSLEFYTRFGRKLEDVYGTVITKYEGMSLIERNGGNFRFSKRGMDVSNVILAEF